MSKPPHHNRSVNSPELQPIPLRAEAALFVAAALAFVAAVGGFHFIDTRADRFGDSDPRSKPALLLAHGIRGAVLPLPEPLQTTSHVFAALALPESQKQKVKEALAEGTLRMGVITLWDTVDEDADTVRINAAGFAQDHVIVHRARTFYVPYIPGGQVRITALHDGGGGVTLGVRTIFGDIPLPRLTVNQTVEIPIL